MKNGWRTAFWVLLTVFVLTTLFLLYGILDQGVTLTYLREGYGDTEADLDQISKVIEGKLTFDDFKGIADELDDSTSLHLNRVTINFGADGKVKEVTKDW